jgi:hypothetical protein
MTGASWGHAPINDEDPRIPNSALLYCCLACLLRSTVEHVPPAVRWQHP